MTGNRNKQFQLTTNHWKQAMHIIYCKNINQQQTTHTQTHTKRKQKSQQFYQAWKIGFLLLLLFARFKLNKTVIYVNKFICIPNICFYSDWEKKKRNRSSNKRILILQNNTNTHKQKIRCARKKPHKYITHAHNYLRKLKTQSIVWRECAACTFKRI